MQLNFHLNEVFAYIHRKSNCLRCLFETVCFTTELVSYCCKAIMSLFDVNNKNSLIFSRLITINFLFAFSFNAFYGFHSLVLLSLLDASKHLTSAHDNYEQNNATRTLNMRQEVIRKNYPLYKTFANNLCITLWMNATIYKLNRINKRWRRKCEQAIEWEKISISDQVFCLPHFNFFFFLCEAHFVGLMALRGNWYSHLPRERECVCNERLCN